MEDFVNPANIPDELHCRICTGVFLDPRAGPCGHTFCGFCLEQWLRRSDSCPLCRGELGADVADCGALREQCDALPVRCPWRCGWSGRRDERAAHSTVCSVGYFVDVTVSMKGPMGLVLETIENTMLVNNIPLEDSAVGRYNESHAGDEEKQIRVNDEVVRVDGIAGSARMLAYLVRRPERKSITFRHPEEYAISFARKGKMLGIDLMWEKNGVLTVRDVDYSAVEECKSSEKPLPTRLLKHDRIIEVNGRACVGMPDSVVPLLLESEEFTIRVHRRRWRSRCSL